MSIVPFEEPKHGLTAKDSIDTNVKALAAPSTRIANKVLENFLQSVSSGATHTYASLDQSMMHIGAFVNQVLDQVTNHVVFLLDIAGNALQQASHVLNFSQEALASNNPAMLQHAENAIDQQIQRTRTLLEETQKCHTNCEDAKNQVKDLDGNVSQRIDIGKEHVKRTEIELRNALSQLENQKAAISERLENLMQPAMDEAPHEMLILEDQVADAPKDVPETSRETTKPFGDISTTQQSFKEQATKPQNTEQVKFQSNQQRESLTKEQATLQNKEKQEFSSLGSKNQETYRNCQTLVAKEQYSQLAKEAQKLPDSLKTNICKELLQSQPSNKESALATAKELASSLSGEEQIYCKCLIALAEGKPKDLFMLAQKLSDSGKAKLSDQLITQGNLIEAEKMAETMNAGPEKNYILCLICMAQGQDAEIILQAEQTKLPDSFVAMLCQKFLAEGKTAEAMLLAAFVKNPSTLQALCQDFLKAGCVKEAVELAKDLPPEVQLALAEMLMEAGCLEEAMELVMQMPAEQQTALLQMLLQKNPALAMQMAAKILQNPEQAKQLLQTLLDKGLLAEAKLLLKLANNPKLNKEFGHLLAENDTEKKIKSSSIGCESEESSTDEEDEEEKQEEEEEEEEEKEEKDLEK